MEMEKTYPRPHTTNQPQIIPSRKLGTLPCIVRPRNIEVAESRNRRRRTSNCGCFHGFRLRLLARGCAGRAGRATRLPELAEVFAEFLAGGCPVCFDAVAQLGHGALDVELVLLEPGDVEFFARGAAFELAVDVLVVVADDSGMC